MSIAIIIYGIAIMPALAMAVRYNESGVIESMAAIAVVCIPIGLVVHTYLPNDISNVKLSVCYMTTLMTWVAVILLTSLPYYFADRDYSYIDCLFEAVASWTTTGASAIATETLPVSLKIWRAICNWMGGIGIILLTLSFLPSWQFVGQKLASTEIRGPRFLMSNMTFRKAYRRIIILYSGLTVVHYVLLRLSGMAQLKSLLTALSNISTSGLQHFGNGFIAGLPLSQKIIITVFAFLGSVNISACILLISRKFRNFLNQSELKMYILIIAVATVLISLSTWLNNTTINIASYIGNVFMQVISFASTAGYIVTDCIRWSTFNTCLVCMLMFIGACAISTGGGLKVSRIVYAFKSLSLNLYTHVHPNSVRTILYNKKPAASNEIRRSNVYIAVFMLLYLIGGILITVDGTDAFSALSYSQAMLTNVGTPITQLADPNIVSSMSTYSKSIMCLLMLCGRLEIYPVMMIFSFKQWTSTGHTIKKKFN